MKYNLKVIKDINQYTEYCNLHEKLTIKANRKNEDTIELLELLIEDFDRKYKKESKITSVELLRELVNEAWESQHAFAKEIKLSPQLVSDILNYRRRISTKTAYKLSAFFALKDEAFTVPYNLEVQKKKHENAKAKMKKSELA